MVAILAARRLDLARKRGRHRQPSLCRNETLMKPITIVGGGLAGLTLGIGLRQHGVPATVLEAGHYPRHRVCGEFISGRGQEVLNRFGLEPMVRDAGALVARTASFLTKTVSSPVRSLPHPACCLSRFVLDALLADRFRQLGGALQENCRFRDEPSGEGLVRTTGRRLQSREKHWR